MPYPVNLSEIDFSTFSSMDIYNIIRVLVKTIALICNPAFFIFSGFFFFNSGTLDKRAYVKKLRTRVNTLLIPYVLWNIIAFMPFMQYPARVLVWKIVRKEGNWDWFAIYFRELLGDRDIWNIFWHYYSWGTETNVLGWPRPGIAPCLFPMWFLQTLIVLTVLSPIIYLICKYLKIYGIIILGLLSYTGIWFWIPGFVMPSIFYFSLGAYYGIFRKNLIVEMRRHKVFWYVVSFVTLIPAAYYAHHGGISTHNYFMPLFLFATVVSAINLTSSLIQNNSVKVNKTLAKATFFIYASHIFVMEQIRGLFDKIFGSSDTMVLTIRYFVVPILTAYACVGIYCMMKRVMPRTLGILAGGR
jgi:hypothetical protein